MRIDVWSDIACPWCYVGKRRLESALARFPHDVELAWRAFELDPSSPAVRSPEPYAARLARKYGMPSPRAEQMIEQMTTTGAEEGIEFRFDRVRPGNTFDAHRLIQLAQQRGVQLTERFMKAYFSEGEPIGDRATLARLASEGGLDRTEAERVLESDAFAEDVRRDEAIARANEIHGVPFFVFANRYGVSGAQPADTLLQVLERVWDEAEVASSA